MKDQLQTPAAKSSVGIVAFVPDAWQEQRQARHHIAEGLAQHYPVLWVSPPHYGETFRKKGIGRVPKATGLNKVSSYLWIYAPSVPADYKRSGKYRFSILTAMSSVYRALWRKWLLRRITLLTRQMGMRKVLLYIWRPEFGWTLGRLGEAAAFYQIDDEYSFNPEADVPISKEEEKVIRSVDAVFIHSKTMMRKKGQINPRTHYVPNGVDFDLYADAISAGSSEPADLQSIPHPRIGYIGHIKRHIDLELLLKISEARPDWAVVLVGPVREDHAQIRPSLERLRGQSNVHFLGGKAASDLPFYAIGFDAAIMPYMVTPYTRYIYPMKMHEYLAAGKPVVSTDLENIREFADVVSFADSSDEWINEIARELHGDSESRRRDRMEVARVNQWSERVRVIHEVIEDTIERKAAGVSLAAS